jgi:hypothetical protein
MKTRNATPSFETFALLALLVASLYGAVLFLRPQSAEEDTLGPTRYTPAMVDSPVKGEDT